MSIAIVASSLIILGPVLFLSLCAYAAFMQPGKVSKGDLLFLRSFGFMFSRFKLDAGYFMLVEMLRSSLLTFTPVMVQDDVIGQSCMLSFTMVLYLAILASVQPWRAPTSNFVFTVTWSALTLCFVLVSVSTPISEDDAAAGDIVALILVIAMLVLLILLCLNVAASYLNPMRAFGFFLCHHKDGAGAMARFLQYKLQAATGRRTLH